MKIKLEIDSEGIMLWEGREEIPAKIFDMLEDAMACFPSGTKMEIEWHKDGFSEFDISDLLK